MKIYTRIRRAKVKFDAEIRKLVCILVMIRSTYQAARVEAEIVPLAEQSNADMFDS